MVLLSACTEAQGARSAFRTGENVVVAAGETIDGDLYAAGGTVTVDGNVSGDVYAAAGTVALNGRVGGDVVASGGQLSIGGTVDGNVAAAGGQVTVSGQVRRDLVAAAGQVTVTESVGGDLRAGAGSLSIVGRVGEDVLASVGALEVGPRAEVGGDVVLEAGTASVSGAVRGSVLGRAETYRRSGNVGGREAVTIRPRSVDRAADRETDWLAGRARWLITLFLLGGALALVAPGWLGAIAQRVGRRPLQSLGWGVLACAALLVGILVFTIVWILMAALFGAATLGGLVAAVVVAGLLADALVVFAFVLGVTLIAWAVVGVALGQFSLSRLAASRASNLLVAVLVGVLILVVAASVPILGGIVTVAVVLAGIGAIGWESYERLVRRTPPTPA